MINGIDVSHHNNMDWTYIQSLNLTQNLYFAFLKVSEGVGAIDAEFPGNRLGSGAAGLFGGGYHFFIPTIDAVQQADVFCDCIGQIKPGELPPVVGIEWNKIVNKAGVVTRTEHWKEIGAAQRITVTKAFLDRVESRLGVKPIIYTAVSFWNEFIVNPNHAADYAFFVDYPLWLVNLQGGTAPPVPWGITTLVQNHFGEKAPKGASAFEKLDHDFFNGGLRGLLAFAARGKVFAKKHPVSAIVRDFQQALKSLGFYAKPLDGDFGKNTEKAVTDFQNHVGLPSTGQIDEITWKMLIP